MLIEKAKDLSTRIDEFSRLKGSVDEAKQLETRAAQFRGVSEALGNTRGALKRLGDAGVPVNFIPKDSEILAARAATLRAAMQSNPDALGDPPFDLKYEFIDRLLGICTTASSEMLAAWQSFIRANSDSASDDILEALAAVAQYRPAVTRIRSCRTQLTALAATIPADAKVEIAQFNTIVQDHRAAWSEMTAEGIPVSVIGFLRACAAEGAPLTGLTEEVRGWLESRKLLHVFRIKIK